MYSQHHHIGARRPDNARRFVTKEITYPLANLDCVTSPTMDTEGDVVDVDLVESQVLGERVDTDFFNDFEDLFDESDVAVGQHVLRR